MTQRGQRDYVEDLQIPSLQIRGFSATHLQNKIEEQELPHQRGNAPHWRARRTFFRLLFSILTARNIRRFLTLEGDGLTQAGSGRSLVPQALGLSAHSTYRFPEFPSMARVQIRGYGLAGRVSGRSGRRSVNDGSLARGLRFDGGFDDQDVLFFGHRGPAIGVPLLESIYCSFEDECLESFRDRGRAVPWFCPGDYCMRTHVRRIGGDALPSSSEMMVIGSGGGGRSAEPREVGGGCGSGVGYCAWRERLRISFFFLSSPRAPMPARACFEDCCRRVWAEGRRGIGDWDA